MILRSDAETAARLFISIPVKSALASSSAFPAVPAEIWKSLYAEEVKTLPAEAEPVEAELDAADVAAADVAAAVEDAAAVADATTEEDAAAAFSFLGRGEALTTERKRTRAGREKRMLIDLVGWLGVVKGEMSGE